MTVATRRPRMAICVEQALGNAVYGQMLERALETRRDFDLYPVEYRPRRWGLPATVWISIETQRLLRRSGRYDLAFLFTHTISLLAPLMARGGRYAVGTDATPLQLEGIEAYGMRKRPRPWRAGKHRWFREVFGRAEGIVTFSRWAASSLVDDYGVDPDAILITHPGAAPEFFELAPAPHEGPPRILFVGGDFRRKGGHELLEAFEPLAGRAELVLVTSARVPERPGVRVLHGLPPRSPELLRAYAEADLFCLPTLADTTGIVIAEAMAAGLPIVTTDVGSLGEWVPSETGTVVQPGDVAALHDALRALVDDAEGRARMGAAGRAWARERMDSLANASAVLDYLAGLAP